MLVSWYKKYIVNGGVFTYQRFLEEVINIKKLNYEPYIKHIIKLFGKENVYIYDYKDLKNNINSFVNNMCGFIGVQSPVFGNVKRNIGYSLWQLKLSLFINHFFKTPLNPNGLFPLKYSQHPHRRIFQNPNFPDILRGKEVTIKDLVKN